MNGSFELALSVPFCPLLHPLRRPVHTRPTPPTTLASFAPLCSLFAIFCEQDEFQYVTLPDGKGGVYQTTRLGLILATVPYVVRFTYRGTLDVSFEELPVGGDRQLLARANDLTPARDGVGSVSPFTAMLMMIGETVNTFEEQGNIKPGELSALFKQIDALTAAEGKISSSVTFSFPKILRALLYTVFFAWYEQFTRTGPFYPFLPLSATPPRFAPWVIFF